MNSNEHYIKRCLQIAKNGIGSTRPNPSVGAVIVHDNNIIGEGFTSAYGGNHAEVNAINSVEYKELLAQSTIYVTLEPCSHHGKTPPCSDLIIKHKIPKVVIGCVDDNPEVAGKGIEKLRKAGCEVIVGVLEKECKSHHKRFFTFLNKKRPYIILKWAESADGFLSPNLVSEALEDTNSSNEASRTSASNAKPIWITNQYSRQLVHKWRTEEHAILVGTNTVIADNPSLTVRDWTGQNPIRVVLDRSLKLSKDYKVFDEKAKTIVLSEQGIKNQESRQTCHSEQSKQSEILGIDFSKPLAKEICNTLHQQNIQSVIIEGGRQTLQTFIDENLWDEARVFSGTVQFESGTKAPNFKGSLISEEHIKIDILRIYNNKI